MVGVSSLSELVCGESEAALFQCRCCQCSNRQRLGGRQGWIPFVLLKRCSTVAFKGVSSSTLVLHTVAMPFLRCSSPLVEIWGPCHALGSAVGFRLAIASRRVSSSTPITVRCQNGNVNKDSDHAPTVAEPHSPTSNAPHQIKRLQQLAHTAST